MPPKARITKEMILEAVLDITREEGFDAVNARSVAAKLGCSTRPVYTCYENMDDLKRDFLLYAFDYYEAFVDDYRRKTKVKAYLLLPLSYIEFANSERHLFELIFVNNMELDVTTPADFYKEDGNRRKALAFADEIELDSPESMKVFFDLFLYAHGIAVLTATGKLSIGAKELEEMLSNVLAALSRLPHLNQ